MENELIPYKPAHPEAPKYTRRTKSVPKGRLAATHAGIKVYGNRAAPKKGLTVAHNKFRIAHKDCKLKDAELTAILEAFNINLGEASIENRSGTTLPDRMGKHQIVTVKSGKKKKISKVDSKRLGYEVNYNKNTGGGIYPLAVVEVGSDSYNMPNKYFWEFKAVAHFKQKIRSLFLEHRTRFTPMKKDYLAYYRKEKFYKREFAKKMDAELLLTYNEFDFS